MNPCQNCGKLNNTDTNFCRFCGTKLVAMKSVPQNPYGFEPPRPYAWKTDEFQTETEPRRTGQTQTDTQNKYGSAPMQFYQEQAMGQQFRCPNCLSNYLPRMERRISTAGWITFAVLLVFFFPLFWIGLLIKEDVPVCQNCNTRIG